MGLFMGTLAERWGKRISDRQGSGREVAGLHMETKQDVSSHYRKILELRTFQELPLVVLADSVAE